MPHKPKTNPWLIALAVVVPTFMEVMDTSIASVAVPYIAGSTASTPDQAEWVLTVYLVSNAIFLLASDFLAKKFGRKRYFITSVIIFTVASFLCGIAPSLGFILFARAIQGAGGGALQPLSQAILLESFPKEKQGMALGIYALGVVLAPVIGPAFGGYLTDAVSWRWAFYINIPVGIITVILQTKILEDPPEYKKAKTGRFDFIGFGLLGLWIGALQFVLDKGQEDDWFNDTKICIASVVVVLGLMAWLYRMFTAKEPLVNLRAFKNRNLAFGCFLVFTLGGVLYGLTTVLPVLYQTLLKYDATSSGLAVSPRGLGAMVSSIAVGVLVSKIDPRYLVAFGFAVLAFAGYWMSGVTLDVSQWSLFWPITLSGSAIAMIFVPLSSVALGTLGKKETGNASAIFNFLRNVGGSVGISISSAIVQRHTQTHRNEMVHSLTSANPNLREQLSGLTQAMSKYVGAPDALKRAWKITELSLNSQASLWGNVDCLRYFAMVSALCVPLAFLLKKPKPGAKPAAG